MRALMAYLLVLQATQWLAERHARRDVKGLRMMLWLAEPVDERARVLRLLELRSAWTWRHLIWPPDVYRTVRTNTAIQEVARSMRW